MSSGGAEVPVGAVVIMLAVPGAAPVLAAAVVATAALAVAGAAAVLVARAAAAGGEAMAAGLVRIGELIESQQDACIAAQQAADLWQLGVAQVVDRNARITAMAARARAAGAQVELPATFDVAGENLAQMHEWCRRADTKIARARADLDAAVLAEAGRRLGLSLPPAEVKLVTAERLISEYQARLAGLAGQEGAAASGARDRAGLDRVAAQVTGVLSGLDPDAHPGDVAEALAAAAQAKASSLAMARSHAEQLGIVVSRANRKARDAREAARLLQVVRTDPLPCGLDARAQAAVAGLEAVVASERALDGPLVAEAERVRCAVEAAGVRQYLRDQVRQVMTGLGYRVESDFTTLGSGADSLKLAGQDWSEHHLLLVLDGDELRYEAQRDYKVDGDTAALLDRERCDQAAADLGRLRDTLRSRGVDIGEIRASKEPAMAFLGTAPQDTRRRAGAASAPRQAAMPLPREGGTR